MKSIKLFFVLTTLLAATTAFAFDSQANHDTLPLGPSKHKLVIDKIEADQIIRTQTGKAVSIPQIIDQTPNTRVYIIGEAHDNYQCHTFQRDFIEALFKKNPNIVVGFEFFRRQDNQVLEQWRLGKISQKELLEKTEWYKKGGLNYGYTRLVMDIIKKHRIKTIGLNIPRTILRKVSRSGYQNLSKEEKALFPTLSIPNPQHQYFIKRIFGTFAAQVPFWFTNVYTAQKCWDVVMAESMREQLSTKAYKDYKGVIIAGSNHVAYHLGIPFRYRKAAKKTTLTTIVPIPMPSEKDADDADEDGDMHPMMKMMAKSLPPVSLFSRGIADYVFAAAQPLNRFFPTLGITLKEKNGKFSASRVSKGSIADKNGIREGDFITHVDGVTISSIAQLRLLMSTKNWDDSIELGIQKQIKIKKKTSKKKKDEDKKDEDKKDKDKNKTRIKKSMMPQKH